MAGAINLIILKRDPNPHADGSIPGTLYVGDKEYPTIERGQGYTTLKIGDYRMEHSWKNTGRRIRCLRPVEDNIAHLRAKEKSVTSVLIHAAYKDSSLKLEGCVSPGMKKKPDGGMGILDADEAMDEIFELLGGFQEGKTVVLHVANNAPGDTRIKETWDRVQNLSIRNQMGWAPGK